MIVGGMDKNLQELMRRAGRIFEAYDKGERSKRWRSELHELQEELDALMPHELPAFLKRPKRGKHTQ